MKFLRAFILTILGISIVVQSGWSAFTANTGSPDNIDNDLSIDGSLVTLDADSTTGGVTLQLDEVTLNSIARPQLTFIGNATSPGLFLWGYDDGAGGVTVQMELDVDSQLTVAGDLDVNGDVFNFGQLASPYEHLPIVELSVVDGGASEFKNKAIRHINTWSWEKGSPVGDKITMRLLGTPAGTKLSIFDSSDAGSNQEMIVLDADVLDPKITVGGEEVLTTVSGNAPYLSSDLVIAAGSGQDSVAINTYSSWASGDESLALGFQTKATNLGTVALGVQSEATGLRAVALGANNISSGYSSSALGKYTEASGHYSTTAGFYTEAQGYGQFVIGEYNIGSGNSNPRVNSDSVFVIGNGTSVARSNAFTVDWDGNTWMAGELEAGTVRTTQAAGDISMGSFTN
ncbi:MAG: hypothetical protein AAGH72_00045 [Verrucomicrobiota bacterium]